MKESKMKHVKSLILSTLIAGGCAFAQSATDWTGRYANMSESSFVYTLDLTKDGQAIYREPDPEGGKALVLKGKWTLVDSVLTVDLGKKGRYMYSAQAKLSWESFGCREASQGFEIKSTPRGNSKDSGFHLWRASDLKRADQCKRL
jgi:hypothetical protein